IAIGIAALIVVLSVMNGVMSKVRENMLSMTSHAAIRSYSDAPPLPFDFDISPYMAGVKGVTGWAPYVQGQGLVGDSQRYQGVVIQGVDPQEERKVSTVFADLPAELTAQLEPGAFHAIIGQKLLDNLGLQAGDKISLIVPKVTASAAGLLPRIKRFTVVGSFKSGHHQFDSQVVLTNVEDAAKLLEQDGLTGFHIMLEDALAAPQTSQHIAQNIPPYSGIYASDWSRDQAAYFNAVQTEKTAMFIILSLIVIVAAFGLLSSMYMVVTEKRRDIAILRTMGMTRGQIRQIFLTQGLTFGGFGMIAGVILGIIITVNVPAIMDFIQRLTGYSLPAEMYFINELNVDIDPAVVIGISVVTLLLTLLFSVIPAQIAAKTEPARALSHE
ncbi:MAG: ABC transporter permease, partial [Cardiobacteriaceae bacterium]|nr:ABC transporter permease [Cardiobacteriaceae bacterium]